MTSSTSDDTNPLEQLLEEFLERQRRGERPAVSEYTARYPELAGEIRDVFPMLAMVERFKPGPAELPGPHSPASRNGQGAGFDRLGDYRIVRPIDGGGMGMVYEAERESLQCRVALKVMHPEYRSSASYLRRFHREARLAAALHHTNIVSVFDFGEHDGVCYYAMQYIAGHGLDAVLDDMRRLRRANDGARFIEPATQGEALPDRSRRTVTLGLLTGQFAAEPSSGETETDAVLAESSAQGTGSPGRPTGPGSLLDIPAGRSGIGPTAGPGAVARTGGSSSSSLAGTTEDRYHREVARIGAQVADALEYAHRRRVLHRDIKPSNLLLDAAGNIWVTDFGLARFTEGEDLSKSQDLAGTLRYMAPERFRGASDCRCDVYALGATLYELLTLRPAFEGQDQLRLIERIAHAPPVPPRQIDRRIPRDLETIVLKAMAKDPGDRFATAQKMADELKLFLENRPLTLRSIPVHDRLWRWCKRDPRLAAATVTAAGLMTLLAFVSTVAAFVIYDRNQQFVLDNQKIQQAVAQLSDGLQAEARAGRFSRQIGQRYEGLATLTKAAGIVRDLKLPRGRFDSLRDEAIACLALPDLKPVGRDITWPEGALAFAFNAAMTRYAIRFRDGTIQVRRVTDDQVTARFPARGDREIFVFGFSPDGRYLATTNQPGNALAVWDIDRGTSAVHDLGEIRLDSARFSPDSRRMGVLHTDGEFVVHDLGARQPSWRRLVPGALDLAFRADGAEVAILYADEPMKLVCGIFDAETGCSIRSVPLPIKGSAIVWGPDGAALAISDGDRKIYVCDAATGTLKSAFEGPASGGIRTAFHSAGTLLASNGWEGRLRLWDPVLGRPWLSVTGGSRSEGFSRDGRIVLHCEGKLTTYQVDPALEYRTFAHASSETIEYARPSIRRDGRLLAVGTNRGAAVWDLARGTELAFLPIGNACHLMFEASGDLLTNGPEGVQQWPVRLDTGRGEFRIGPPRRLPLPAGLCAVDEDRTGRVVALAHHDAAYIASPERTIRVGPLDDCRSIAISPDGAWLATGSHETGGVQVRRVADPTAVIELRSAVGGRVHFSPDGKWLMTGAAPCRLWTVGTWRKALQTDGDGLCFSADSRLVVVAEQSRALRLVETATGRALARLESPDLCGVGSATFSPDGSRLVLTTNEPGAVHVWDLRAIRKRLAEMGLDWVAPAYPDDDPADRSAPSFTLLQTISVDDAFAEAGKLAQDGRWEEAAAVHARVLSELTPEYPYLWFRDAILRLAVDDAAGYRSNCRHMLDMLRDTDAIPWMVYGSSACVFADNDPAVKEQTVPLAERRFATFPDFWTEFALGLALYRDGRFADARARLMSNLARVPPWGDHVQNWVVLAMVEHKLGRSGEARGWLERADRWVAARLTGRPGGVDRAVADNWTWDVSIILHLLLREAHALLGASLPELPAEVFVPDKP
jgi:eukaryotic-like serine/threonine-protein kinase